MRRVQMRQREPAITLINIVFLLLVFFLVAGTLAPPLDRDVQLIETRDLPVDRPPDALVIHADGSLTYRGNDIASVAAFLAVRDPETRDLTRVVPDRAVPATDLIRLAHDLAEAGSGEVVIVTERGLR